MNDKLLFVTRPGEGMQEGFPYVVDLAHSLKAAIKVLIVRQRTLAEAYDDAMAAIAFAQAGERDEALSISKTGGVMDDATRAGLDGMRSACDDRGISFIWEAATGTPTDVVKRAAGDNSDIRMVLLSQSLSEKSEGGWDIKKLIRKITKPVFAITRPMRADGGAGNNTQEGLV